MSELLKALRSLFASLFRKPAPVTGIEVTEVEDEDELYGCTVVEYDPKSEPIYDPSEDRGINFEQYFAVSPKPLSPEAKRLWDEEYYFED